MSNNAKEIRVNRGTVEITKAPYISKFQKEGSKTVEVKQLIKTTAIYQGKNYNTGGDDVFGNDEFGGAGDTEFESKETRYAWIMVPAHLPENQIMQRITGLLATACVQRTLSNAPILDESQLYYISQGVTEAEKKLRKDAIAETQVVRYGKEHEKAGQLVLHNGKVQYRRTYFRKQFVEDIDLRGNGTEYVPSSVLAEMNGAVAINEDQVI